MKELTFKEAFPELNDNQVKLLERVLLETVGPDITSDKHITRDYNRKDEIRDQVNQHKKAIRSRIKSYLHGIEPTNYQDKE